MAVHIHVISGFILAFLACFVFESSGVVLNQVVDATKRGCPKPIPLTYPVDECSRDSDCPGTKVCCPYRLGEVCWPRAEPASWSSQDDGAVVDLRAVTKAARTAGQCGSTGSNCVSNCTGVKDGDYQSCHGCDVYVSCVAGVRYDDRACAPGGLVWDDNKKRCEYNSTTCHGCLCPPPCSGTGPTCRRSCYGLADGLYQSCDVCYEFLVCHNSQIYREQCRPYGTVWDDFRKQCSWWSDTCHAPHY